jgi:hypothetical protein
MSFTSETDGYDAADNTFKCYSLGIRTMRLEAIKAGKATPNLNDEEELEVARQAGFLIVQAEHHRRSA